ncbi:hypothetical protein [Brachybacterium sp. UMB0905]|uniref:hypothetical protein n=1 Tax=Brachybacterium sp. UMB0905 TaxID=2069310 RepID=UPI000C804DBB|nr:hypothetical protein [Brachybacterium sp. UMB0905]PMC76382.1 hypothetical protein CJ197_04295 [Brachybacterium sp. UMB0905]
MTTTDPFTTAANTAAREYARTPRMNVGTVRDRIGEAHADGWEAARRYLAAQEPDESVLMDSHEEHIADRLADAGYTECAEDEDGWLTWVSAPLGEVLRIVSAAQEPSEAEVEAAALAMDENFNPDRYPVMAAMFRDYARVALSAARAARRDEEE